MSVYSKAGKAMSRLAGQKADLTQYGTQRQIQGQEFADLQRKTSGIFGMIGLGAMVGAQGYENISEASEYGENKDLNLVDGRNMWDKFWGGGEVTIGKSGGPSRTMDFENLRSSMLFHGMKDMTKDWKFTRELLGGDADTNIGKLDMTIEDQGLHSKDVIDLFSQDDFSPKYNPLEGASVFDSFDKGNGYSTQMNSAYNYYRGNKDRPSVNVRGGTP